MKGFMDYVQDVFYSASRWNLDNSYGSLTATSEALLDFETPAGIRLHISSLSSPHLASSYTLSSVGLVDGSLSYLYSSLALPLSSTTATDDSPLLSSTTTSARSATIPLPAIVRSYRHLTPLSSPDRAWWWEIWRGGRRTDRRDTLLYGRMFLPSSALEALYLRRLAPTRQLRINAVSSPALKNGGTILALLQQDTGKYSTETLYSTDSALVGFRGLWNLGLDPRTDGEEGSDGSAPAETGEGISSLMQQASRQRPGRLSLGGEVYYGILNKSGGMSTGLRFTTLEAHTGFPLTMTATLNPLMGNLSASYAVKAGEDLSMAARFDFNVFSYESGVVLGCELWRRGEDRDRSLRLEDLKGREETSSQIDGSKSSRSGNGTLQGVLKARVNQKGDIGVLWEGRIKELLFSLGTSINLRNRIQPIRAFGVEFQYSS